MKGVLHIRVPIGKAIQQFQTQVRQWYSLEKTKSSWILVPLFSKNKTNKQLKVHWFTGTQFFWF